MQEKVNDRLLFNLPVAGILQRWMLPRALALLGNHVPESDTGGELRHRRRLNFDGSASLRVLADTGGTGRRLEGSKARDRHFLAQGHRSHHFIDQNINCTARIKSRQVGLGSQCFDQFVMRCTALGT